MNPDIQQGCNSREISVGLKQVPLTVPQIFKSSKILEVQIQIFQGFDLEKSLVEGMKVE